MQHLPKAQAAGMHFRGGDERCEECARKPLPATAIHPWQTSRYRPTWRLRTTLLRGRGKLGRTMFCG